MFTHRQPREVYRVYGEDEFFAEEPTQEERSGPASVASSYMPPEESHAHESAHAGADIFEEYDTVARGTPLTQDPVQLEEPWASWEEPHKELEDDPHEPQRIVAPLLAARDRSPRRIWGIFALTAIIGLLFGLIVVHGLRSGHTRSVQAPPANQSRTSAIATSPAETVSKPDVVRRRTDAVKRRRPSSGRADRLARSIAVRTSRHHANLRRVAAPAGTAVVRTQPEIPVTESMPPYAPTSSSGGTEFGFEH
jgi:hypothetical protein